MIASLQFFLVTNFGVWLMWSMYPHTPTGLLGCYEAGLPFFRNQLVGDLGFAAVLFGLHAWLARTYFVQERVAVAGVKS